MAPRALRPRYAPPRALRPRSLRRPASPASTTADPAGQMPRCSSSRELHRLATAAIARALHEGVDQRGCRVLEQRLEQRPGDPIRKFEAHLELDPATELAEWCQRPQPLEYPEWPADELHEHAAAGFEQITRGELGLEGAALDIERRHHLVFLARDDPRGSTPGHEIGITLDIVD